MFCKIAVKNILIDKTLGLKMLQKIRFLRPEASTCLWRGGDMQVRGLLKWSFLISVVSLTFLLGTAWAVVNDKPKPTQEKGKPGYAEGELLVKFKEGTSTATVDSTLAIHSLQVKYYMREIGVQRVKIADGMSVPQKIEALKRSGLVEYAEPNYIVHPMLTPDDPEFSEQWALNNTVNDADIDAPEAWGVLGGFGATVTVAVIDTGIAINHPDLAPNIWTNPGEIPDNGIDDDGNGYVDDVNGWDFVHNDNTVFDLTDGDMHGTHVAGTIGAVTNNTLHVAGVNGMAKIMSLKFLGPSGGTTADAIQALEYAVNKGAFISNNSWGSSNFSQALYDAIKWAGQNNHLFCAAAGNDGLDIDNNIFGIKSYPAAYDLDNIIAVAATDNTDALASFSNRGPVSVDIAAPGVNSLSTIPQFGAAITVDTTASGASTASGTSTTSNTSTASGVKTLARGGQPSGGGKGGGKGGGGSGTTSGEKHVYMAFGFENISDTGGPGLTTRKDIMQDVLNFLGTSQKDPILLVDDDGGDPFEQCYAGALSALGYNNVQTYTVPLGGDGPDLTTLTGKTVIWETGDEPSDIGFLFPILTQTLTSGDQRNLTKFLANGGKLFLSGEDIGWDLVELGNGPNFYKNTLHATYLTDSTGVGRIFGVSGTAFNGREVNITAEGDCAYRPLSPLWPSGIAPNGPAVLAMQYENLARFSGTSMATPHVTAVASLIRGLLTNPPYLAIKQTIMNSADPKGYPIVSGGRLNAYGALNLASTAALTASK